MPTGGHHFLMTTLTQKTKSENLDRYHLKMRKK